MLLKELSVTNSRGSTLTLPLEDASGGFVIKDIKGLGPVKATLVSSSFADQDGEQYHSSRREARNILIKLGLDPDYAQQSVYDLRTQLYNFFMPKTEALLKFTMFDRFATNLILQTFEVEISGRIEVLEPNMFTNEPTVDLSIMCYDPDFVDPNVITFNGFTVPDLTETILTYDGSVDTGVLFTLFPDRVMTDFTIYHKTPDNSLRTMYFVFDIDNGEKVEISSIHGEKHVTLTSLGVESSILYAITYQSAWLELEPGDNAIRVHAEGAPVPYSIEYTKKYGGL